MNKPLMIDGTEYSERRVRVEISPKDVVKLVERKVIEKFPEFKNVDHISNGNVVKYIGDNHHNGDPEYEECREATAEDYELLEFMSMLREIMHK